MLKSVYDNKSEIPTGAETFYKETDGKFHLQVTGFKTEEDVNSLQDALNKERKEKRDALAEAKTMKDKFGLLPEDFDINEFNRLKDSDPSKELDAKLNEQRERITKQFETKLAEKDKVIADKDGLVTKYVKNDVLRKAMTEIGVSKQFIPAVEAMFKDKIIVEGENILLNEQPVSTALKDWSGTDEGKHFIQAPANNGGGSNNSNPNGDVKPENMTSTQKIAAGLKKL